MSGSPRPSILSSLFIDFDNIYLCLKQKNIELAQAFASHPQTWLMWLHEYLETVTDLSRRIAVRRCYMNPNAFSSFRSAFMLCGFEIIECPPLTKGGKTSADIRIVVDMLELEGYQPPYKEFILLSADADFTPVMLKLRKSDRRAIALAVGESSPIYRAYCTTIIDQEEFIKALTSAEPHNENAVIKTSTISKPKPKEAIIPPKPRETVSLKTETLPCLTKSERKVISDWLIAYVQAASEPVLLSRLAPQIHQINSDLGPKWAGCGTCKKFLQNLNLAGLNISSGSPGYVYAPDRHTPPASKPLSAKTPVNKE